MKTLKMIGLMAMLCFIMPAFVSCDKDDDDPKKEDASANTVIGDYTGTMTATVSAMGNVWENLPIEGTHTVKITKQANSEKVTVEIPECTYAMPTGKTETIPALSINDVDAETDGVVYTLFKDEFTVPVDGVQYSGKIISMFSSQLPGTEIKDKDIKLVYSVVPGKMPGSITFTFIGKAN